MRYMLHKCVDCGKERRIEERRGKPRNLHCHGCSHIGFRHSEESKISMSKNSSRERGGMWKGGCYTTNQGYIAVLVPKDDFFASMRMGNGYVLKHRLVMAKSLGRCLHTWEIVHHKNHIRIDNRIENLELYGDDRHKQITIMENKIRQLEQRITVLEAENILLREPQYVY